MWRFEVRAPDGRTWHYDRETDAKRHCNEFNSHVPRGGKLAVVVTQPTFASRRTDQWSTDPGDIKVRRLRGKVTT